MKNKAFQTKTEEEYRQWQKDFRVWYAQNEWWNEQTFANEEQLTKLNEQKESYFSKLKQHPVIQKNNYILREEEGKAFARLCNVLADVLERQPRFALYSPSTIASNGVNGTTTQGDGENVPDGEQTNK